MCEVRNTPGPELKALKEQAVTYYERAERKTANMHPCNATKLSLALNYSVFTADVMNDQAKANKIAEMSLNRASNGLNSCDEEEFVEACHIIEMIKENAAIWSG